jgi:hypothetical protein
MISDTQVHWASSKDETKIRREQSLVRASSKTNYVALGKNLRLLNTAFQFPPKAGTHSDLGFFSLL